MYRSVARTARATTASASGAVWRRSAALNGASSLTRRALSAAAADGSDAKADAKAAAVKAATAAPAAASDAVFDAMDLPTTPGGTKRAVKKAAVRLESMERWKAELQENLRAREEDGPLHDTVLAQEPTPTGALAADAQAFATRKRRAAVLYRVLNTPLARALRPEQDNSVTDLHVLRLTKLRALMGTYRKRDAYKRKYVQRPIRVDFTAPKHSLSEKKHAQKDQQWMVPLLQSYQRDLAQSVSPWPVGKQELFLQTARKVLYKRFNHSKLTPFQNMRPLPPAGPGAAGSSAGTGAISA